MNRIQLVLGLALAAFIALPSVQTADAQALRVGYTDHELLLVNRPRYRDVQTQLQQSYLADQEELQTLAADFQEKVERYQRQQAVLSAETRQLREQELQNLQQQLQLAAQEKEQGLGNRRAELMQPLLEDVNEAIEAVAKAQNLDLVLRAQIGFEPVLLYVNEDTMVDITLDVARRLGIEVDEEPESAATTGAN